MAPSSATAPSPMVPPHARTFHVHTFGCQQNVADSERITTYYRRHGLRLVEDVLAADVLIVNTCMIRDMAEERVYGFIRNVQRRRAAQGTAPQQIVVTGCLVGAAQREPSGTLRRKVARRLPGIVLRPIEDFSFAHAPTRSAAPGTSRRHAWVVISHGCNNYCSFCIVPYARGPERSRPYDAILAEVRAAVADGYDSITLLGQNVNSYGADLVRAQRTRGGVVRLPGKRTVAPIWVSHLGRMRIPTLFPHLLADVAQVPGVRKVTFTSANPWDFSDELIDVIARHPTIDRLLHLPVQSGSARILKAMNRWYTPEAYLALLDRIRARVPGVHFMTDIIVGFPGETEEDFRATVALARRAGFVKAFIGCFSPRPGTRAATLPDDVPWAEKKRRFHILDDLINKAHVGIAAQQDWIAVRQRQRTKEVAAP